MNKNIKEDKKWDYEIISDNTDNIFKKFNEIYDKNREAARYFILGESNKIYSQRIVVFINKKIHIIVKEQISYGVSISLKRYKSVKTIEKYYIDTNNGSISRSVNSKFIPCKTADISTDIKEYIISKMKWIDFIFKLNLPVTFSTIVTKKLYSERKLLSWFWGTNYSTALKLQYYFKNNGDLYTFRKNVKNIKNINNINPEFFKNINFMFLFINTLHLSVKTLKKINAAWSYKRLLLENKKLNRLILDKLYDNYNVPLPINEFFLPFINRIKSHGYYIPKTTKEFSNICNCADKVKEYLSYQNSDRPFLIIKKNNFILLLTHDNYYSLGNIHNLTNQAQFYVYNSYSNLYSDKDNIQKYMKNLEEEKDELCQDLNRYAITHLKADERKKKIIKIKEELDEELNDFFI